MFFLLNNIFGNFFFQKEKTLFLYFSIFIIYLEILIIYIVFNDLYYSNFFDISYLNINFFELQIEIDNFVYNIISFFFDLNKGLVLYQIFIIYFIFIQERKYLKNKDLYLFFISVFIFFY
jgi:hypothetical protein